MAAKLVSSGEAFKVYFHTGGSGSYTADVYDQSKGPFNSQEDALRWVKARLEERLGEPVEPVDVNAAVEGSDPEIAAATEQAMKEADQRQAEQEAAAARGEEWRDVGVTTTPVVKDEPVSPPGGRAPVTPPDPNSHF